MSNVRQGQLPLSNWSYHGKQIIPLNRQKCILSTHSRPVARMHRCVNDTNSIDLTKNTPNEQQTLHNCTYNNNSRSLFFMRLYSAYLVLFCFLYIHAVLTLSLNSWLCSTIADAYVDIDPINIWILLFYSTQKVITWHSNFFHVNIRCNPWSWCKL